MDLVFLPFHLHRNLLLHSLLHRQLSRYRIVVRSVSMCERSPRGQMLLIMTDPLFLIQSIFNYTLHIKLINKVKFIKKLNYILL